MKTRRNQILAGILLVQAVIVVIALFPRSNAAATSAEPLLAEIATGGLQSFTITDGEGEALTLAKDGEDRKSVV